MKKQHSLLAWLTNISPMLLLALFVLLSPAKLWADPVAIGTGTVTLDKDNTSNPSPITNKIVLPQLNNEECITFGYYSGVNDAYTGGWAYPNGIEWSVTLLQGVYDIEVTYGTGAYGTRPFFDLYDGNTPVKEVFHAPSDQTSGANPGKAGFTGSNTIDLSTITEGKTYTLKASDGWTGAYGTCIGHISFTRKEGVSLTAFGQETDGGATTLPSNGSNTINNVTVSTNMTIDFCNNRTYDYIFGADYTDYVDIAVDNSLKITGLATSVMYDGSGSGKLYIQFCSTTSYDPDHKVGEAIELSGHTDGGPFYTYPPTPTSVSIPNGTIKSARIYRVGTRQYGIRLYRIAVFTAEDVCASPLTATFSAIEVGVTGDAPANISECLGNYFEIPNANTLHYAGHKFTGWKLNNTGDLITAGTSYEMPAGGASFVAQWESFTVPTVTNLAVGEAVDKEVPLSWSIPGICDLSNPVVPIADFHNGTPITPYPVSEDNIVTVEGSMGGGQQFGVAFNIGDVTGITSVSFKAKDKSLSSGVNLWIAAINTESRKAYWEYDDNLHNCHPGSDKWYAYSFSPNISYWNNNWSGTPDYNTDIHIQQIGIFANAPGGSSLSGQGFYVNEVRYHVAGREDIDHVIVVRKAGSAPANSTDGTVYNVGTKSHFLDNDNTKEIGQTYYYSVYAVHADGTLSAATTTSHTIVATPTCNITFNVGDGAIGDAPTSVVKPANGTVTMPSANAIYKPFCTFGGWKKDGSEEAPLAAGATYTVTADDVTAENISFTAQWTEDNTTLRIPADASLYWENKTGGSNDTKDFNNEKCVDLYTTHNVEWLAYITPGYYDISMMYGAPYYGIRGTFSIIDPSGVESDRVFYTQTDETNEKNSITKNIDIMKYDLTGLKKGKLYKIKVEHDWGGSYLCIGHINFTPHTPINIASETVLDANNTVTTGLTEETDVDFPGDNDESINLYNKQMDWVVKLAKGYYNISLLYGAPEYSTRVSVALIDPEGVEPTRWFCPDQTDRNGHYHYTSGSQGNQYYSIGAGKYNLNNIDPDKTYIVRVHDEYNGSNQLRVKNLTFTLLEPIEIENEVVLNAANSITPNIAMATSVDFTGDSNPDEAMNLRKGGSSPGTNPVEWEVTIARGIYNLALEFGTYSGSGNSLRAKVELIDPSSVESDKVLMTKYVSSSNFASNQYVEIALGACAFTSVTEDKKYIIRVSDNSDPGSYCSLLVRSLTFTPVAPVEIPSVTRLDATNVFDAPGIVDSRIDIKNRQEAVWYANMTPYVYDINLHYTVASGDTKVRFGIIDVESGDTAFVHQQNKYGAGTYTISVPGQDLRSAITAGKMYKIIVKDNYANNGSVPQIDYLEIVHHAEIHTRSNLHAGDFGTVCLPYAIAAADISGAEIYKLIEWPAGTCAVTLESVENMEAGHPYIYQATASTATWRYYPEGTPTAATSENGLIGSYSRELITANANNYIIYNNKLYYVDSNAYVGAFKAYINRTDAENAPAPAAPAPGKKRIQLAVNGTQTATGLEDVQSGNSLQKVLVNGQLFIIRDGKTYTAQGQLVTQ